MGGTDMAAIPFDDFLLKASTKQSMNVFHHHMLNKYKMKLLGKPKRLLV